VAEHPQAGFNSDEIRLDRGGHRTPHRPRARLRGRETLSGQVNVDEVPLYPHGTNWPRPEAILESDALTAQGFRVKLVPSGNQTLLHRGWPPIYATPAPKGRTRPGAEKWFTLWNP